MTPDLITMHELGEPEKFARLDLSSGRYIYFGPFQIDQQREEVNKDGARIKLQGKVYQALLALLEKPGEVVTREELRQRLWPADKNVNYDANVNTTVNKLRLALGDSSEKPLYVETIPRKGYSFVARPEVSDKLLSPSPIQVVPGSQPDQKQSQNGAEKSVQLSASEKLENSISRKDLWLVAGVIGLILAGMVLGAGLTRLWIAHFSQPPSYF